MYGTTVMCLASTYVQLAFGRFVNNHGTFLFGGLSGVHGKTSSVARVRIASQQQQQYVVGLPSDYPSFNFQVDTIRIDGNVRKIR